MTTLSLLGSGRRSLAHLHVFGYHQILLLLQPWLPLSHGPLDSRTSSSGRRKRSLTITAISPSSNLPFRPEAPEKAKPRIRVLRTPCTTTRSSVCLYRFSSLLNQFEAIVDSGSHFFESGSRIRRKCSRPWPWGLLTTSTFNLDGSSTYVAAGHAV